MTRREASLKKSDQTRTRIFEAALALFRKHGFGDASMREIAKEAGVALGAAYYYFDSKDAIVMAFYEHAQEDLATQLEKALSNANGLKERLGAVISVKLEYFEPNRNLMAALSTHIDPRHPLSPFSVETRAIREKDIGFMTRALEGSKVRIQSWRDPDAIYLQVLDEGDGIPPDDLEHIFDKFYRAKKSDQVRAGTGLGLAISRGFVEAMHGTIIAANRSDRNGAVFTIQLPIPAETKQLDTAA